MTRYDWSPALRARLRKVGRDRMSSDAWDLVEDLLTRVEDLEAELFAAKKSPESES